MFLRYSRHFNKIDLYMKYLRSILIIIDIDNTMDFIGTSNVDYYAYTSSKMNSSSFGYRKI